MVLIANFWIILVPSAQVEVAGVAQIDPPVDTVGPLANSLPTVQAINYPLLNTIGDKTKALFRNFPERNNTPKPYPPTLWSCYMRGDTLGDFVGAREDFQMLGEAYPGQMIPAGSWLLDGQPIGGVGSPWFITPPELATVMGGDIRDIVLLAGQAKRNFI